MPLISSDGSDLSQVRATEAQAAAGLEIPAYPVAGGPPKAISSADLAGSFTEAATADLSALGTLFGNDGTSNRQFTPEQVAAGIVDGMDNGTRDALVTKLDSAGYFLTESSAPVEYDPSMVVVMSLDGTDAVNNDAAISASLAAIASLLPTQSDRASLIIRSSNGVGDMSFNTPFQIPKFVDVYQQPGTRLRYRGTDYSQAAVTIGETVSTIADWELTCRGLNVSCPDHATHKFWRTVDGGTVNADRFAAVRIGNTKHANIDVRSLSGFYIGLQLFPASGSLCSYARVTLSGTLALLKFGFDLRGNLSDGYVNENVIIGPGDVAPSTSMSGYGSAYGVRFSSESGGYGQNNNNTFLGVCWQLAGTDSDNTFVASAAKSLGDTVTSGAREYVVTAAGSLGASAPTHTDGTVANGTCSLKFIGLYRRAPMLFDDAGQNNHIVNGRYEQGYGSPIVVLRRSKNDAGSQSKVRLGYLTACVPASNPANGVHSDIEIQSSPLSISSNALSSDAVFEGTISHERAVSIPDIRRRAIIGASGIVVPGMPVARAYSSHGGFAASRAVTGCITTHGITITSSDGPSLLIPVSPRNHKFILSWSASGSDDPPRASAMAFDASLAHLPASAGIHPIIGSDGFIQDSKLTGASDYYGSWIVQANRADVAYIAIVFRAGSVNSIDIKVVSQAIYDGEVDSQILDQRFGSINGPRMTNGAVQEGVFDLLGERIADIASATVYRVTTTGVVALAWTSGQAGIVKGQYKSNAGNIYAAAAAGTCGTTAPTHTSGSVSDGLIAWDYVGPTAVLS